ncbi:hypothetical protein N1851_017137 [Merluccius polli]|uniref:Uncharacterized protein n=1 Tax=Merluccius polli TaxID=89951 RepID=A0AA47MQ36_MERPO|nr:hypothetical protein N1851_017137 [Merluccius polli]
MSFHIKQLEIHFKTGKPDALSRRYDAADRTNDPEPILPVSRLIATVTWDMEKVVSEAQQQRPDPGGGPTN